MPERIIRALSITVDRDGVSEEYIQGDTADLTDAEVERYEESGALVPEGFDSYASFETASLDAYRGGHGDIEANARALARAADARGGKMIDLSTPSDGNPYVGLLRDDAPTVDETVALAEGDPEKAALVLEAENVTTGQDPRKGVVEGLDRIIAGAQD